ncbi:MAG: type II secretion system F family protein [Candidatus Fermentibacteraceae bacterium]|nr:type II secretion system F family protein [Candidatus Fermentibacteraceae bacterium]
MAEFQWTGTNRQGRTLNGTMEAKSRAGVKEQLEARGIVITNIKGGFDMSTFGVIGSGVKAKELSTFTRQFSVMINAGLPLVGCLQILGRQQENKVFKNIIVEVTNDVEKGGTLAESLGRHKKVFSELYVNMVAAGEQGGILDTILARLADYLEDAATLQSKIKSAMMYPVVVLVVVLVATLAMLIFVIPIFEKMFEDLGGELPAMTQVVVDASDFVQHYVLLILLGIGGIIFAYNAYYKTNSGEKVIDTVKLSLPVFGQINRKMSIARFTRTLGTLTSSGVAILDGLNITAKTAGNRVISDAIMKARVSISGGENIAGPLEESGVFPTMVTQMIAVGEETGGLDEMLVKVADFYDEEVKVMVDGMASTIEPIMIVFLGGFVGALVVAMYLPIFDMIQTVGG